MNYYISDLHIGHTNALAFDARPFKTIEENDETIKNNWNSVVGLDDDVYLLGDISWYGSTKTLEYYSQLNGRIHLIKGNHEYMWQEALYYGVYYDDFDYPSRALKLWLANGGDTTMRNIREYLQKDKFRYEDYRVIRTAFFKSLYEYLINLPNYLEIEVNQQKYVLVHAGIDVRYPLKEQKLNSLLWIRDDFYHARGDLTKIYIFGHTPTAMLNKDRSFDIWVDDVHQNKIGIDGGLACGVIGQLNCLCLDDGKIIIVNKEE